MILKFILRTFLVVVVIVVFLYCKKFLELPLPVNIVIQIECIGYKFRRVFYKLYFPNISLKRLPTQEYIIYLFLAR